MKTAKVSFLSLRRTGPWGILMGITALLWCSIAWSFGGAEPAVVIPAPQKDEAVATSHSETALFAGGCFWGVAGVFQHVKGVTKVVAGYTGGAADTANYETVSTGDTGHAESVQVTFDPTLVTYGDLLQVFFSVAHNPTELNHQGPDSGTQYRSALFPLSDSQKDVAQAYIAQLDASKVFTKPLVTKIESHNHFYPAEGYHQNYLVENPDAPYIAINDMPKITDLKQLFPTRYLTDPVLTPVSG
ncbi:peptide-methionine (S)-S-oxide reductase [Rouxiella silvae]|uniref:Peptide methionine sulfoxide reductase MsrA n=1 Tax=Rouxiella silvae TaxID=1646373 RepID=A0AA40X2B4_9GAMM|nr:peptide-methionine (S)-S-oxide reductase MsrA [Rouxiella silvae]KQN52231.1 methionine sulfoxide reductase A [Serratia sp. Leaf50]MBF6637346.1 peptide-methionine (S)-S-oxide reductase MsrA [Rouxiella silvae]ORJ19362.1 peptide-methionine (S)-S-oxide reductase [Rouxiella silvae]